MPEESNLSVAPATAGAAQAGSTGHQQPRDVAVPMVARWQALRHRLRIQCGRLLAQAGVHEIAVAVGVACLIGGLAALEGPITTATLALAVGAFLLLVVQLVPRAAALEAPIGAADRRASGRVASLIESIERQLEALKDGQWELSEGQVRYRDLLDAQADAIVRRGPDGIITFVNRAFCDVFGVAREAVIGTGYAPTVLETQPAAEPSRRGCTIERVMTARGPRWYLWQRCEVTAVAGIGVDPADAGERQVQLQGRDITEERAADARLAEARDAAEAASRAKSRFLASMSHEIRTPMNGILGMTSLLAETELTPEQHTYARAIGQSARTLLALIDEILDFSKIEAGRLDLAAQPFDLAETVQGVVELLAPRAHQKGLEVAWMLDPAVAVRRIGDEMRVRQIVMNLLGNAIKFTDRGGITLSLLAEPSTTASSPAQSPTSSSVRVVVADTGIGLEPQSLERIFAEFEQADQVRTRRQHGTGLGLAISRRLARAMGGDIHVESTLGIGSTFTAELALPEATEAGTMLRTLRPDPHGRTAWIATQHAIEGAHLARQLEAFGVPSVAMAPQRALETLSPSVEGVSPPTAASTLLVVDAGVDVALARRLLEAARSRADSGAVEGIVLIASADRALLQEYRAAGFGAYLMRPVRPASLASQIARLSGTSTRSSTIRPAQQSADPSGPTSEPNAWRPRILLAEDNDISALLAVRMLEKAECAVERVRNGREALEALERAGWGAVPHGFDLVLMDVHMPEMDGLAATRAIRARQKARQVGAEAASRSRGPAIIALTANAFADDRRACLEAGMDDFLSKPFERADLIEIIERWCSPAATGDRHGTLGGAAA